MKTASLFTDGNSQAVRLPPEFRFEGKQVFITRDERTGNVMLSAQPLRSPWRSFMALRAELLSPVGADDLLADRRQGQQTRDPLVGWVE